MSMTAAIRPRKPGTAYQNASRAPLSNPSYNPSSTENADEAAGPGACTCR